MFKLESKYKPTGDQPRAIETLVNNFKEGKNKQVLLGATGTGKTFTMCNVIAQMNKPTLILAHNKTLAGQLYSEIKEFFPNNHVEYFISYYDYFQPESYVVSSDTFIEKDSKINEEIDEMRHSATAALIDYKDVIVVASVSCIYGIGDIESYKNSMLCLRVGENYDRKKLLLRLVEMQYQRNEIDFTRGTFRMRGDVLEIISAYESKKGIRVEFFDDEIERIRHFDIITGNALESVAYVNIFAATHFVTNKETLDVALQRIKEELDEQVKKFESEGKLVEAQRIKQRTNYDIEMLSEVGSCSGVENYSRHLTLREEGEMPSTLIDFLGDDFLFIIDESHVTLPQVRGMFNGDRSRKENLVNYGFRLPSALDNRPLRFHEFEEKVKDVVFVSATPGDYEMNLDIPVVEQIIRPTGLLDPIIEIRPSMGQVDDMYSEIISRMANNERVLITTLTIKMSEDLTDYLKNLGLNVAYLHSEIKALERMAILRDLRLGKYDVLIGINLLREGLDLPEVSLVCILDANKQGFLRSSRSLIQTIGRAARNASGKVIMYADSISDSMQLAIEETTRRRKVQEEYNAIHGITPTTVSKAIKENISYKVDDKDIVTKKKLSKEEKINLINQLEEEMKDYAKNLNFEMAAQVRDAIMELKGSKK